jgi:hypothetical protein
MYRPRLRTILIGAGSAFVLMASGGIAYAAIASSGPVDSSGAVHGCYTNQAANGSHVVVLQDAGTTCPKGTTAITWSAAGPTGPAGPQGPAGTSLGNITGLSGLACSTHDGQAGTIAVQPAATDNTIVLTCVAPGGNPNPTSGPSATGVAHTNGVGQTWTDFTALDTYNLLEADSAASAFISAEGGSASPVMCGTSTDAVQVLTGTESVIWQWAGQYAGRVVASTQAQQYCPTGTDPAWH